MRFHINTLQSRIFLSMLGLILASSVLMGVVTMYQSSKEADQYHQDRLYRKERTVKDQIKYQLNAEKELNITPKNIDLLFKKDNFIYELADIHRLEIKLYNFQGEFIIASDASSIGEQTDIKPEVLPNSIIEKIKNSADNRHVVFDEMNGVTSQSSYSYIKDKNGKPLAVLGLPYIQDSKFLQRELNAYLKRMTIVYLIITIFASIIAYISSRYIAMSLQLISQKIHQTKFDKYNTKIKSKSKLREINTLVYAYNSMVDQLQESAIKLAKSEREQAWREMAKQVAHEIKNPLTPMRLTVQSFQMRFDPNAPDIRERLKEHTDTIIQQIDTMSNISEAFSDFAKMHIQKNERLNIVEVTKLGLEIFNQHNIIFQSEKDKILINFDRTQLIRIITNLVKNSIQARAKNIKVAIKTAENNVILTFKDDGDGISEANQYRIFEPKFTTKTSGMGLGLAMVKKLIETYNGEITFESDIDHGTTFTVILPKQITT